KESFEDSRKTYGTRRIKADLESQGITISRRKIGQIMQKYKLVSKYTITSFKHGKSDSNKSDLPNILNQEFTADRPMQKLTTDLTYVRVKGRWCYACLVLDLYNREIVGWSVGPHKTADLVLEAMRSIPYDLTKVDVFHTDR
ncbi:IS3 family transposase, partial [Streptococcus danieliae]|nr:IS3 family transposase [Streptococcus danieliae]